MIAPITRIIASTENARGVSAIVIIRIAQLILTSIIAFIDSKC